MATPIRKKRNFKGLGLSEKALAPLPVEPEPLPILGPSLVASRPAPTPASLSLGAKGGTDTPASDAESMIAHNGSTSSISSAVPPSVASKATSGASGGPKKKKPVPLSLGAKSVGGSAAAAASNDRLGAEAQTNGNNAGKAVLDENGMLTIPNASSAPGTATIGSVSPFRSNYQSALTEQLEALSLGKTTMKADDLREIGDLGSGNGGSVKKVTHLPTGTTMAKKIVLIDAKPSVRKQILRELHILHGCHDPHIVSFYGAFVTDPNVCICLEFMDKGSLDKIYKKTGPIPIDVVGKIAFAVLSGLTYLYDVHRIIHRDIKPSNMLVNSSGEIKICDFGVSGELINSIADTFVGTSTYMSPERIQGAQYTVKSDVWSTGISLIELALGRFPFSESSSDDSDLSDLEGTLSPSRPGNLQMNLSRAEKPKDKRKSRGVSLQGGGMTMSILELLQHIVNEPAPRLTPEGRFPVESEEFVDSCLLKDPDARPTPKELLNHVWIQDIKKKDVDLVAWAATF
ncbi:Dual specificity protein kinase FUZ7 [Serendipita indica DSM 11827]|nr:Dual specificity protein kinase FUZ7 [Serendipita indica DSM 11827]